jgi:hypothetical protein
MISTNSTNTSTQTFNRYAQKPNVLASSKEQSSFSLPAATVGLGLAVGIPGATYLMNGYEYKDGKDGHATAGNHEFFNTNGNLHVSDRDTNKHFKFDQKGKLRTFNRYPLSHLLPTLVTDEKGDVHFVKFHQQDKSPIMPNREYIDELNELIEDLNTRSSHINTRTSQPRMRAIYEKFDESGKRTYGVLETDSFQFPIADQAVNPHTDKTRLVLLEKQINGKNYTLINPHGLGVDFKYQKGKIIKELGSLIVNINIEHEGVNYIAIKGPVSTAEERLKDLPKDIPTQFKDVEKYLKDLQVKRSLIGLGIGSGLGVLAYLGVTQLTKPKTEKPS